MVRTIAEWNPVTTLSDALRELFGNPNTPVAAGRPVVDRRTRSPTPWIWIVGIIVVCAPLAVRAYKRKNVK